jgi:hypothetical protein
MIHLNFLPAEVNGTHFPIYRRKCTSPQEERPVSEAGAYKLPVSNPSEQNWPSYWVLLEAAENFETFDFRAEWNADVTRKIIFNSLRHSVQAQLKPSEYRFPDNHFIDEVSLVIQAHPEGQEELVIQPYSLKTTRQTGFLVDFHFRLAKGIPFSRKIQQTEP